MAYDSGNIFAKIIAGDIPCNKIHEDDHTLAFHDIHPQAPVHVLLLPKGAYTSMQDFSTNASDAEQAAFTRAISKITSQLGLADGGYRLIMNCGSNGGQEVPHLHLHILGGGKLGPMTSKA